MILYVYGVYVYLYVSVYICIYIYIHLHICVYIYIYTYIHIYLCICVCGYCIYKYTINTEHMCTIQRSKRSTPGGPQHASGLVFKCPCAQSNWADWQTTVCLFQASQVPVPKLSKMCDRRLTSSWQSYQVIQI